MLKSTPTWKKYNTASVGSVESKLLTSLSYVLARIHVKYTVVIFNNKLWISVWIEVNMKQNLKSKYLAHFSRAWWGGVVEWKTSASLIWYVNSTNYCNFSHNKVSYLELISTQDETRVYPFLLAGKLFIVKRNIVKCHVALLANTGRSRGRVTKETS